MQPTPSVPGCPHPDCTIRTRDATPRVIHHSLLHTRTGTRQRWRCKNCGRTFVARSQTPYHRLRSPAARFEGAVQMSLEGMSKAGIARAIEVSASTVGRWLSRAAVHARRFQDEILRDVSAAEVQADEVRGSGPSRDDKHYVFAAVEVGSRLWLSQRVGRRTRRNCLLLLREARRRSAQGSPRTLIVTDPFRYYRYAVRRAWGPTCVHVESSKIIRGGRIVRVRNTLVYGTDEQLKAARERCEDSKKLNTAYIERLNLFVRRALASLHRRTTSLARSAAKLGEAVTLLQCYYNFVRPHGTLKFGGKLRTPAQQAKLVRRRLTWREVFMAFRPMARVSWIVDDKVRANWGAACRSNT